MNSVGGVLLVDEAGNTYEQTFDWWLVGRDLTSWWRPGQLALVKTGRYI